MIGNPIPDWLSRHLDFSRKVASKPPKKRTKTRRYGSGFSEDALEGLRDLEARSVPPGVEARPAFEPSYVPRDRLSPQHAAGGGLVVDDRGNRRPHYHGHRERLRQRFLRGGHEPMPDYELLELVLFNAITRIDVKPLAKRLLAEFGSLSGVVAASKHRVLQVEGATEKVYIQLRLADAMAQRMAKAETVERDVFSSWEALLHYCQTAMAHREVEQFRVLYLDRKNRLLADEAQAEGTVDHVPVYPREIAKRALELNASAIILVHNHPSGDATPSPADIDMTGQIRAAIDTFGITLHEHLIVGKGKPFSFRTDGLL